MGRMDLLRALYPGGSFNRDNRNPKDFKDSKSPKKTNKTKKASFNPNFTSNNKKRR